MAASSIRYSRGHKHSWDVCNLRHIMATISQTIYSDAFSLMESLVFFIKISLKFVPKGPFDNNGLCFGTEYVTSHYLNQCWPDWLTYICDTRGRWVYRVSVKGSENIHYNDVIMGAMAFKITSLTIVYSTVHSSADQRKQQSSSSLAFVRGIHQWLVNSSHKWPVTRKMFPFDDVIMIQIGHGEHTHLASLLFHSTWFYR